MFETMVCGFIVMLTLAGILCLAVRGGIGFYEDHEAARNYRIKKEVERQLQIQKEKE